MWQGTIGMVTTREEIMLIIESDCTLYIKLKKNLKLYPFRAILMYICDETTSLELLNYYFKMSIAENVNVSITHVTNLNLRGGNEKSKIPPTTIYLTQ